MNIKSFKPLISFTIILVTLGSASAQSTGRVHTIVVPQAPGGVNDISARFLAEKMAANIKAPVIVENKPGAGSRVAAGTVKNATPDGTTMLMTYTATAAVAPFIYKNVGYNFQNDYAPVAKVATAQFAIIVPGKSTFKSIQDLQKFAQQKPGALNFGTPGVGTLSHLTWYRFGKAANIQSVMVPFKGGSSILSDLIAGHVDAAVDTYGEYIESHRAGKVRILGVFGASRAALLPDVPTISEQGIKGVDAETWYGLFVPAKTPAAIIKHLEDAVAASMKDPDMKARLENLSLQSDYQDSASFAATVQRDIATWQAIVRESGITAD